MSALDCVQHASACAEKMTVDLQADPFVDIEALGIKQNGSKRSAEIQATMHLFGKVRHFDGNSQASQWAPRVNTKNMTRQHPLVYFQIYIALGHASPSSCAELH